MSKAGAKSLKPKHGSFKIYKTERKLRRKKKRLEKKRRNKIFNSKKYGKIIHELDIDENDNNSSENEEEVPTSQITREVIKKSKCKQDQSDDETFEQTDMTCSEVRKLQHKEAVEYENKNIKKLEKLLKIKKKEGKAKIPKGFKEGGLDYILEILDGPKEDLYDKDASKEFYEMFSQSKDPNENNVLSEHSSNIVRTPKLAKKRKLETEQKGMKKLKAMAKTPKFVDEESDRDGEVEEDSSSDQEPQSFESDRISDNEISDVEEAKDDIYGQKNAESINIHSETEPKSKKEIEVIHKSLNHCLKFIKDSEFQTLFSSIEQLYRENSRNAMNEALYKHLETYLFSIEENDEIYIKLSQIIALLHVNIGNEVGAYILQNLASHLDSNYKEKSESVCTNICTLISYLFIFDVCHSLLLFDIIKLFSKKLAEIDIKLILIILRNSGFPLRKSDPITMQALVKTVSERLAIIYPAQEEGSPEYLLNEILHAIKKKSLYKKLTKDPSEIDHLKKQVKLQLPKGTKVQSLKISFQDILDARNKIGWWIVGGGWEEGQYSMSQALADQLPNSSLPKFDQKLMDLAASYNMNTELRKTLFCILMTAKDTNAAFEKILGLKLRSPHERDVIVVIILTCFHYKRFHPMFGLLLQKLCIFERKKYLLAIKCCLWDQMKEIGNFSELQISIFAKLLTNLLANNVVPTSILKPEHFANFSNLKFIRLLLLEILLEESEYNCKYIFKKISKLDTFKMLGEAIKLYLNNIEKKIKPTLPTENQTKLEKRLSMVTSILNPQLL